MIEGEGYDAHHYGQGEALIHPYNRGVRAIIRVHKEGVRVG